MQPGLDALSNLVYDGWQAVEEWHRVGTKLADDGRVAAERCIVVAVRVIDGRVQRRQVDFFHADHHAKPGPYTHSHTPSWTP